MIEPEARKKLLKALQIALKDYPGESAVCTTERTVRGESPLGRLRPEWFMVDISQHPSANPAYVLILNHRPAAGNQATVKLPEQGFGIGNVVKNVPHTNEANRLICKGHRGSIYNGIHTGVGEYIGRHHFRYYQFDEPSA